MDQGHSGSGDNVGGNKITNIDQQFVYYQSGRKIPRFLTKLPALSGQMIGREEDLQQLKERINRNSCVLLVNGLGGIGKTVLATAYVQSRYEDYNHLAWINRGEDLITSFALHAELADTLEVPFEKEEDPNDRFGRILRALQQLPGRNLLVIDNVQEQIAVKDVREQLPGPPNWDVLLTSRLNLAGYEQMRLDIISPEAGKSLFRTHFQGSYTEAELEELLGEIGYHTLTIELLARLLDRFNNILSLPELTTSLRQKQLNDPDLQEKIWVNHAGEERGVFLHLMKAFELSDLGEKEKWLLKQFIVLPVEPYPVDKLADLLQEKPFGLNKVLNSLTDKGWLTRHEDKTFSIHRLIRQMGEYQLTPEFSDVEQLMECLIQKMSVDEYTSRLAATVAWISYAVAVVDYFTTGLHESLANLQNNIALTYHDLGQYEQALSYHQKALVIKEGLLNANDLNLTIPYSNIALIYIDLGQYKHALNYHQKALAIKEKVLETDHIQLATSYNNIAMTYYFLGRYDEALNYNQKDLAICESALEANHPSLATSYNNIATTYLGLGKHEDALSYHQKALAIREEMLEANHPSLATSYNNIAATYRALKQYDEALRYLQKALVIKEEVLESNHPDLATSYNDKALTYRSLGRYDEALSYHQKAQAIWREVLEANHPYLATSYNNIGLTYHVLGQYEETLNYYQKALAILEEVLEANHPYLATCYNNIALTYRSLEEYEQSLDYHQKALAIRESVLESNHPSLANSYNNIALTYYDLGRNDKAEEYEAKAAAINKSRNEQN